MNTQQISSAVDHLATNLGVPSERLVEAFALEGSVYFTTAMILLTANVLVFCFGWLIRRHAAGEMAMALSIALIIISIIIVARTLPTFLIWCQSPEAYALTKIARLLK